MQIRGEIYNIKELKICIPFHISFGMLQLDLNATQSQKWAFGCRQNSRRRLLVLVWKVGKGMLNTKSSVDIPHFCFVLCFFFFHFFKKNSSFYCEPAPQQSRDGGNSSSNGGPAGPQLRRRGIFLSDLGSCDPNEVANLWCFHSLSLFSCLLGPDVGTASKGHNRAGQPNPRLLIREPKRGAPESLRVLERL